MKVLSLFKKKLLSMAVLTVFCASAFAINPPDEGMWLPMFIKNYNYATMQKLGVLIREGNTSAGHWVIIQK